MPKFAMPFQSDIGARKFAGLDQFTRGYVEAMFWTDIDASDDPKLSRATFEKLATDTMSRITADCQSFQALSAADLASALKKSSGCTAMAAGLDFWCTRNGQGVGFWDGDWPEPEATRLSKRAKNFGSVWVYAGDDGRIYASNG